MVQIYYSRARERALQILDTPRVGSWIAVTNPSEKELDMLSDTYGLDRDTLEDAIDIYEAPRIETYQGAVYLFTRYCHPEGVEIATEPLLIVYTNDYIFTLSRIDTTILDRLIHDQLEFVTTQKTKTVLWMLDEINKSYEKHLTKVARRVLQLRAELRQSRLSAKEFVRIIELEEDLNEFLSALQPQSLLFNALLGGKYLRLYEDDRDMIEDIERSTGELIGQVQGRLRTLVNMRQAYDAIATTNLNATFKRLTSIAIFLTIPTIVGGLWGMNVAVPFANNQYAFAFVLAIVLGLSALAVLIFRKNKWL
ncbi:magnesium transporter CorA family protein [Candidatus Saccharibacteria bacterium]|nr:MAG: magnesium transporter CorA family protein [Candidatus Saccharibacteria bacterium]